MPLTGISGFLNEEIITESVIARLSTSINTKLNEVWTKANDSLSELGLAVPATNVPIITDENFFRFDLKEKFNSGRNTFVVGAKLQTEENEIDGGIALNNYLVGISYHNGLTLNESDIKRDYYAFRVRDAVLAIMETGEKWSLGTGVLNRNYHFTTRLIKSTPLEGEGFNLEYLISS